MGAVIGIDSGNFLYSIVMGKKCKGTRNPTHIVAHLQALRDDAKNQSLKKNYNFANTPG